MPQPQRLDLARVTAPAPTATRSGRRRMTLLTRIDAFLFAFAGVSAIWLAYLLLRESVDLGWRLLLLVGFWVVFTYLLLPRLHRILTTIYVPDYFIGRARTSDGLLGDPVNLALLGHEGQLHAAMESAGWTRADDLSLRTGLRIVRSTLSRHSYRQAPVSPLLLFDRQQDFAYQQEVAGSPSKRHHVRFWRCPPGWLLPGGARVEWLAAGTYDRAVGLSLFTLQITHKIEENTDIERDHILQTVQRAAPVTVTTIENFATGYHARNGGGDLIETDGDLPILDLASVPAPPEDQIELSDSRDRRPAQIVFGGGVGLVRGLFLVSLAVTALVSPHLFTLLLAGVGQSGGADITASILIRVVVAVVLLIGAVVDAGLGLAVLAGRLGARLLLMTGSVFDVVVAFVGATRGTEPITASSNLPLISLSILLLLSLSSHRAREYTARRATAQLARRRARTARRSTDGAPGRITIR